MAAVHPAVFLVCLLAGVTAGLVTWGQARVRLRRGRERWPEARDGLLLALLMVAAFGLAAFLIYVLLGMGF